MQLLELDLPGSRREVLAMKADNRKSGPALVRNESSTEGSSSIPARSVRLKALSDGTDRIFRYLFRKPDGRQENAS